MLHVVKCEVISQPAVALLWSAVLLSGGRTLKNPYVRIIMHVMFDGVQYNYNRNTHGG